MCKKSMCVKEKVTTKDKLERECVFLFLRQTYHACISEIEKRGEEIHKDRYYVIVCNGERHPYSTCPIEVWPTRKKGREGHMDGMDAWGGREGVFVIERSPRDREGTIWVGDRGSVCAIERCPERNRDRPCTCL